MALNEQQGRVVACLDGSVNVVAGAGTGKTFTLTQRIIAAVERAMAEDPHDDDPASHILAITFTRKAAGELKSRVRQAFLEAASQGGENADRYLGCALRIDSAWISTIHAMASRILRENALDFGIDPSFRTLTAQGEQMVFSLALQRTLDDVMESGDDELVRFVIGRELEGSSRASHTLGDAVREVLASTSYMPDGLEGIELLEGNADASAVAGPLMEQASLVRRLLDLDGWSKGDAKKVPQLAEELDSALGALESWLASQGSRESLAADGLLGILGAFPPTTNKFGKASEHYDAVLRYRLALKYATEAVAMVGASKKAGMLVRLAAMVKGHMDAIKATGRTKFTESDLLVICNQRLSEPENLPVLMRYRKQFRFIMLDEFQDTDPLQMALIAKLSIQPDAAAGIPPLSNVCTVGDMQQSIYRFRGGDVEETQKRMESMARGEGSQFELTGNYRSHRDVLDAVKGVFSQPQAFGDEFLDLHAARREGAQAPFSLPEGAPRVEFLFLHGKRSSTKDGVTVEGVSSAEVRAACALEVARRFRMLADGGARPSQMALLLGRMTYADTFAQALRDFGFECVITGGSVFADTPESKTVAALLAYGVNQHDDVALLGILTSGLIPISDDALLALVRRPEGDSVRSVRLSSALLAFDGIPALSDDDNASLALARRLLIGFSAQARDHGAAIALRRIFSDSGRLLTLREDPTSQSLSEAGNIAKAIRIVEDLEAESSGIAEVAAKYASHLAHSKEAPGVLAVSGSEYIQIMTVHASKGLEFDHVALAEIDDGTGSQQRVPLVLENIDGRTYVSYGASKDEFDSPAHYDDFKKIMKFTFEDLGIDALGASIDDPPGGRGETKREIVNGKKQSIRDAATYELRHRLLCDYHAFQELEESRRLMYVAMTRARETLLVTYGTTVKTESGYKGTFDDIYRSLTKRFDGSGEGLEDSFRVADGVLGARRVAFESQDMYQAFMGVLGDEELPEPDRDANAAPLDTVTVPIYDEADEGAIAVVPYDHSRRGIQSYTSLSRNLPEESVEVQDEADAPILDFAQGISLIDDEMALMMGLMEERERTYEDAAILGTAFHRLCQTAIIEASSRSHRSLAMPTQQRIDAQARSLGLSDSQRARLQSALVLWFGSDLAHSFASHDRIAAEVPFAVAVTGEGCSFVLEGEIDALADNGDGHALLIDYKTGMLKGASYESLEAKHRLQSQCYAYALLAGGYERVTAYFVKVEESRMPESTAELAEAGGTYQPVMVKYSYGLDDVSKLRDDLMAAYQYSIGAEAT